MHKRGKVIVFHPAPPFRKTLVSWEPPHFVSLTILVQFSTFVGGNSPNLFERYPTKTNKMAVIKPNVRAGAAYLWFFNTPITAFTDYVNALDTTTDDYLALPQIDTTSNSGAPDTVVDIESIYTDEVQSIDGSNRLVAPVAPEQQMNAATLQTDKTSFELTTQFSSNPIDYTQTGVNATLSFSVADIDFYYLALALGFQQNVVTQALSATTSSEVAESLQTIDNASAILQKFEILIIPAPWLGPNASEEARVRWRNSWVYLPQAVISEAQPALSYGIEEQQMIEVTVNSLPDFRSVKPYDSKGQAPRALFGYPVLPVA